MLTLVCSTKRNIIVIELQRMLFVQCVAFLGQLSVVFVAEPRTLPSRPADTVTPQKAPVARFCDEVAFCVLWHVQVSKSTDPTLRRPSTPLPNFYHHISTFNGQWQLYVPPALKLGNFIFITWHHKPEERSFNAQSSNSGSTLPAVSFVLTTSTVTCWTPLPAAGVLAVAVAVHSMTNMIIICP